MRTTINRGRKIVILAVLATFEATYSIASVALTQIKLLSNFGCDVTFVTSDDFIDASKLPHGVEVRHFPRFKGDVSVENAEALTEYARTTSGLLIDLLADADIVITHDVLFIHEYLPVNWAIRFAAESLHQVRWFHWVHSAPSKRPPHIDYPMTGRYSPMINSRLVYVNRTDIGRLAEMYAVREGLVETVYNPIDPFEIWDIHPLAQELLHHTQYHIADFICVYPLRLTAAKQPEKVIRLFAALKQRGFSVRIFLCNSYSNAAEERSYATELFQLGERLGLTNVDLVITSEFSSSWCSEHDHDIQLGVPRRVVTDLLRFADTFILPSLSEACSLVMLEAGLSKNCMILNDDIVGTEEFLGYTVDGALHVRGLAFNFGSVTRAIHSYVPSEDQWYDDHARILADRHEADTSISFFKTVRKKFSPHWIFENQLKPMLFPDEYVGLSKTVVPIGTAKPGSVKNSLDAKN